MSDKQHVGYFLSKLDTSGSPWHRLQTAVTRGARVTQGARVLAAAPGADGPAANMTQEHVHLLVRPCYDCSAQRADTQRHKPTARAVHRHRHSSSATDCPAPALGFVCNSLPARGEIYVAANADVTAGEPRDASDVFLTRSPLWRCSTTQGKIPTKE